MAASALIIGDSTARVWGLSGAERLRRLLAGTSGVIRITGDGGDLPNEGSVLVLRGDYVFDPRLLRALADAENDVGICTERDRTPVAARVQADRVPGVRADLAGEGNGASLAALVMKRPSELVAGFETNLRKWEIPRLTQIAGADIGALERELFGGAYKGVTDLITKWLWPVPALWATRLCVRLKLRPNHITAGGLVLAVLAAVAFWEGEYGAGLLMAWIMTFLDTVDGKLARVTVTASRFGDLLDHGLDLLHPPVWYAAWGLGMAHEWSMDWSLATTLWLMLFAYVGGRLCEGAFQLLVAPFSLFVWRPLDSVNRLITARRNPNLILLSAGWCAGRPDLGLWWVVIWHLLSTAFLAVRVAMAWLARHRHGPQEPWLAQVDPVNDTRRLMVRMFSGATTPADRDGA